MTIIIEQHTFTGADGMQLYGHLSMPSGPGPHPAVVVHTADRGGALNCKGEYSYISEHAPLVSAGFAVFTVDQRGAFGHGEAYQQACYLGGDDVQDLLAGARYVARRSEIDDRNLSLLGTSRGAYAGLLALTQAPDLFRSAVLLMGFYDPLLYIDHEQRVRPTTSPAYLTYRNWDSLRVWFTSVERQPLRALDRVQAPLYAIHGNADDNVPVEHVRRLRTAAEEACVSLQVEILNDLGHDVRHEDPVWAKLWPRIASFLKRHCNGQRRLEPSRADAGVRGAAP